MSSRPTWQAWALFAPLAIWLALFVVAPTLILLVYSFFVGDGPGEVDYRFTWLNYARVFGWTYVHLFAISIGYAGLTTLLCAIIGYPVAWFIGRAPARWRGTLLMLVMIPFMTSFLIRTYAWFTILHDRGLLNGFLAAVHIIPNLIARPLNLLYTPTAVIIGLVYTYLPFMILPIFGSVEKLDVSLLEAASDLGAGPLRSFVRVILPLTWPGIMAGVLMVFVPAIAMFAITTIMSGGHIRLIGDVIQDQFGEAGDLPFGSALGMALLGLFIVTYWLGAGRRSDLVSEQSTPLQPPRSIRSD
jgi:spermidine/putrescine transport system permease protein